MRRGIWEGETRRKMNCFKTYAPELDKFRGVLNIGYIISFRLLDEGICSSSRYLLTVRREIVMPCSAAK